MTFDGFSNPTRNYFGMPNEWIDICAEIKDISELKVIQYVIRHTWGFHEYGICKTISVDEFMRGRKRTDRSRIDKGTGLSEQSVRNGLKKAIEHGYLLCEIDPSDAGRTKKSYKLKLHEEDQQVQTLDPPQTLDPSTGTNFIPQGSKDYTPDSQSLDPRVPNFIPRTEKDTLEKHSKKNTLEKKGKEDHPLDSSSEEKKPAWIKKEPQKSPLQFPLKEKEQPDPRSMTSAQQKRAAAQADKQEEEALYRLAEEFIKPPGGVFDPTFRDEPDNRDGIKDVLKRLKEQAADYNHTSLRTAFERFITWSPNIDNFTWRYFNKRLPKLLSGAHSLAQQNGNGKKEVVQRPPVNGHEPTYLQRKADEYAQLQAQFTSKQEEVSVS